MLKLDFPSFDFKYKKIKNNLYIFDQIRKKFVFLTPEEWVRQHTISYLINFLKYPKSKILVEKKIKKANFILRCDIIVRIDLSNILLLVECKSPMQNIDSNSISQLMKYNKYLNSKFLFLTNGLNHLSYCFDENINKYKQLDKLSIFNPLVNCN